VDVVTLSSKRIEKNPFLVVEREKKKLQMRFLSLHVYFFVDIVWCCEKGKRAGDGC
jgi:hypothetical protein